jgi:S1-C subfamily serine protease
MLITNNYSSLQSRLLALPPIEKESHEVTLVNSTKAKTEQNEVKENPNKEKPVRWFDRLMCLGVGSFLGAVFTTVGGGGLLIAIAMQDNPKLPHEMVYNKNFEPNSLNKNYLENRDKEQINKLKGSKNYIDKLSTHFSLLAQYAKPAIVIIEAGDRGGSGFIYSQDGLIITNNHVINNQRDVKIILYNGEEISGKVISTEPDYDLAIIKINKNNLPTLKLSNIESASGEFVMAIGHPGFTQLLQQHKFNTTILSWSSNIGILSAKDREVPEIKCKMLQSELSFNPGNSGGPLLNMEGEVIGLNQATAGRGIAFSIPADTISKTVKKLTK